MLILTRRIGESLVIGDDVQVTIVGAHGNQVRLGIHAPQGLPVHRSEVYQRLHGHLPPAATGEHAHCHTSLD